MLIGVKGDSFVRGMVNTFRSIHSGPVLLNVDIQELDRAARLYSDVKDVFIITQTKITSDRIDGRNKELILEDKLAREWQDIIASIVHRSAPSVYKKYYL